MNPSQDPSGDNYQGDQSSLDISKRNSKNQSDEEDYVYCQCFYCGFPESLTTKFCMDYLNDYFQNEKRKSRCIYVNFSPNQSTTNGGESLQNIGDVENMVEKIKKSIDRTYFQFKLQAERSEYQIPPLTESEEIDVKSEDFLRNFLFNPNDPDEYEEMTFFQDIENFCKDLLENPNDDNRTEIQKTQNSSKTINIYGPRKEIEELDNKKVLYSVKGKRDQTEFFFFHTKELSSGKLVIIEDPKLVLQAQQAYNKHSTQIKISNVKFGILDSSKQEQQLPFYELLELSCVKFDTNKVISFFQRS